LLGTSIFPYDTFLVAGILEWGRHALLTAHTSIFDWTAGFPLENSLAVTENFLGWQIFYLPLRLLGAGIPAAYNILILVSLVISGISAAILARRFGASRAGGALAGLVFAYGPFHLSHILHLQTLGVCWIPFAIFFLDQYLESRSPRDAIGLAASLVISVLCSIYLAVFLALVLPLYAILCWIFGRYRFNARALGGLLATGIFAAALLTPILSHYLRFSSDFGYAHDTRTLANFSMELAAPLRMPDWMAVWAWTPLVRRTTWTTALSYTPAFPGLVAIALAIYAIITLRRNRENRATMWILVSLAVICFLLALGPILRPINLNPLPHAGWLPMPGKIWLVIPGIRWPMRIFFFAWLAGAILCGLGLTAIERRAGTRSRIIAIVVIALVVIEYWPASWFAGRSVVAPAPMSLSDAYPYLASEVDRGGVVELPTADHSGWRTPFSTRYIYASAGHLRRVVALHGSVTPPVTDSLRRAANALPDSSSMKILLDHGVSRVVVHRSLMQKDSADILIRGIQRAGYPILFAGSDGVVFGTVGKEKN
jgi:uncharacterized protein YqgC (DUF456 family)